MPEFDKQIAEIDAMIEDSKQILSRLPANLATPRIQKYIRK
jgi:hypothetical protein